MKGNSVWRLSILAFGLVIGLLGIVHPQTNNGPATAASGWWNRRLSMAKPVKPTARILRQRVEVANRSPEAVAQDYLGQDWEWLIGADTTDRGHGMSYSYTKTSPGIGRGNTTVPAVEFQQLYRGVPVYGSEFGISVPSNPADPYPEFGGRVFNIRGLNATPTLSKEGAVAALKRAIAPDSIYSTELVDSIASPQDMPSVRERMRKMTAKLFVYPSDPPRLIYQIFAQVWVQNSFRTGFTFSVDAHSGDLLQSYSLSQDFNVEDYFGPNKLPTPKRDTTSSPRIMPAPLEIRQGTFPDTTLRRMDRERDSLDQVRPRESYPERPKRDANATTRPETSRPSRAGAKSPDSYAWAYWAEYTPDEDFDDDGYTGRGYIDWDIDTWETTLEIRVFVYAQDFYGNERLVGTSANYEIHGQTADNPAFAWAAVSVPYGDLWDFRLEITEYATGNTIGYLEYGELPETGSALPLDNLAESMGEDRVFINLTSDPPGVVLEVDGSDSDGFRRAFELLNKIRVEYDSTYTIRTRIYAGTGSVEELIFESIPFDITYQNNNIFVHDFGLFNDSVWYGAHGLWDFHMDIVGAGGTILSSANLGDAPNWTDVHLERWNEDPRATTVFLTNPIHELDDATLWDQEDVNWAVPKAAYSTQTLSNLDSPIGEVYWLAGTFTEIDDFEAPSIDPPSSSDGKFPFFRDDDGFEAVMCYHIIDRCKTYLNSIGFASTVGYTIHVDPHGFSGANNSRFNPDPMPGFGQIEMGDGGTDQGEDGDFILHEYGHAIVDYQTGGRLRYSPNETQAMNSGFCDYWACSWADSMHPGDFGSYFWAEWGARDYDYSPTFERRTNSLKTYPSFMVGEEHADGEIWSHALWDIMGNLGKRVTDSLLLRALGLMNSYPYVTDPSFTTSAQYIARADALTYNLAHLQTIGQAFEDRGICMCYCEHDPICDGVTDVLDVVEVVAQAFRNKLVYRDAGCPTLRADATVDGNVDVLDVVRTVNVAFRNADPGTQYGAGCPNP